MDLWFVDKYFKPSKDKNEYHASIRTKLVISAKQSRLKVPLIVLKHNCYFINIVLRRIKVLTSSLWRILKSIYV